jgi:hypothetical protein
MAALCATMACGAKDSPATHSHAADAIIDQAATPEERVELRRVRDEVDAAARKRIAELDAEIAELERENAALRERKRSTD